MKIHNIVFGGGISTLGMSVIKRTLEKEFDKKIDMTESRPEDLTIASDYDLIFVSLYWYENILKYFSWIKKIGLNPKKKKPIIVIGGMSAINIRILHGYFNYCILGDGEVSIIDFVRCLMDGSDPGCLPGVVKDGDFEAKKILRTNPVIPNFVYCEFRDNRTARIEIARGCRYKCAFCQLAHIKPYREQPIEIVEHLLLSTPTKSVGLFAPDRTGYTWFDRLEATCRRIGKNNTAEDTRLDMLMKKKIISKVKFGIEGFSETSRRRFHKLPTDEQIKRGFNHIFNVLRTPKGKKITTATVYMIGDLPGEGKEDFYKFFELLREIDEDVNYKFTLFLTLNSFTPMPFTPMEKEEIHPYNDWGELWKNKPRLKNITTASRGGMLGPSRRLAHNIALRGDERLTRLLFYLSTDGAKILRDNSKEAGLYVERLIKKSGVEPEYIYGELSDSDQLPHHFFEIEKLNDNKSE